MKATIQINQVNPNWETRIVVVKGWGNSLQVWSTQRKVWMHLGWV